MSGRTLTQQSSGIWTPNGLSSTQWDDVLSNFTTLQNVLFNSAGSFAIGANPVNSDGSIGSGASAVTPTLGGHVIPSIAIGYGATASAKYGLTFGQNVQTVAVNSAAPNPPTGTVLSGSPWPSSWTPSQCSVNVVASGGVIQSVTLDGSIPGSGYPPNQSLSLNVAGGGGNAIVQITTDASGSGGRSGKAINARLLGGGGGTGYTTGVASCSAYSISPARGIAIGSPLSDGNVNPCLAGNNSIAIGSGAQAYIQSFALGTQAYALSDSLAIGAGATASAYYSMAVGFNSNCFGLRSIAFGNEASASANYSVAVGGGASDTGHQYSTALGYQAGAGGGATGVTVVGATAYASAVYAIAIGMSAVASGIDSVAIGGSSSSSSAAQATGYSGVAIGYNATASAAYYGVSIGRSTTSSGNYSTALGYSAAAAGKSGIAIGYGATAPSQDEISIGRNAGVTHSGVFGIAIGYAANAGGQTTISGLGAGYAVAIGAESSASGGYGTALGVLAKADYGGSTAIGQQATCTAAHQIMLGTSAETVVFPGAIQLTPTTPADNATGTAGQIAVDSGFIYVCTATNTWKKVAVVGF